MQPVADELPFAPAAERNKQAILDVLKPRLPGHGMVLEIGSGTGQHAVHFAADIKTIQWQPSERRQNLAGLNRQVEAAGLSNVLEPVELDVGWSQWPVSGVAAVFAANVAHIMSLADVQQMLHGVAYSLAPGGKFFLYGPFHRDGRPTSQGNASFDEMLRSPDNPDGDHQGIRDDVEMLTMAATAGLNLIEDIDMPANNRILVWKKAE